MCALSVLWSSVECCDRVHGPSKTFVRESPSNTVSRVSRVSLVSLVYLCICVFVCPCVYQSLCLCVCVCVSVSVSPASIQVVDGPASSGVISSSLLSRSAFSSQVTAVPTRNGTGDVMPLAEVITQLSFLEFLQRCGVSIAPLQPSQPPVPISLQDATVQTTPLCDVSQEVSTQTSDQQDTLSCDVAVQTSFYGAHTLSYPVPCLSTSLR